MFLMSLLTISFEIGCVLQAIRLTKKIGPFICAFAQHMIPTDSEASCVLIVIWTTAYT